MSLRGIRNNNPGNIEKGAKMARLVDWLAVFGLIALAVLSAQRPARSQESCTTFADYLVAVEMDRAMALLHKTGREAEAFLFILNAAAPVGAYLGPLDEVAVFYIPGANMAYMIVLEADCILAARRLPASLPMYLILVREGLIPDSGAAL